MYTRRIVGVRKTCVITGSIVLLLLSLYRCLATHSVLDKLVEEFIEMYNTTANYSNNHTNCIRTRTLPSYNICPYEISEDVYISSALLSEGVWEPKMTSFFQSILRTTMNVTVIDIGANIGYFALMAAAMGHPVIAVEPVETNAVKFAKAIVLNGFQERITLLKNVISDNRGEVTIRLSSINQGGHRVVSGTETKLGEQLIQSKSIVLDDLVQFVKTNDVIIKMDIEGHECKAMEFYHHMFTLFNVKYILLEWNRMTADRHRYGVACPSGKIRKLADTLAHQGYIAYDIRHNVRLDMTESERWTHGDIYWCKNIPVT